MGSLPMHRVEREPSAGRRRGFTLVELTIVAFLLAVGVAALIPALESSDPYRVDLAAARVVGALEFARDEAIRTAAPVGLFFDPANERVQLFRDVSGVLPPTPVFDVRNPISKKPYEIDFAQDSSLAGVTFNANATWSGACPAPWLVGFDENGTPRCGSEWSVALSSASIALTVGGHSRTVGIQGWTGRVVVSQ